MNAETRQAVLDALDAARRALDEADLLLDCQPPPKGAIPFREPTSWRIENAKRWPSSDMGIM